MKLYLRCPYCSLCINLDDLKCSNFCIMCGALLKPLVNNEIVDNIKPNY